ncbi:jg19882 [Pararge aegeria aegeria]|uniref:Jg19882 protein n=1 Tax=Pararge aegeria aegeria TaxID=348720 RepID=A0A8S4S8H7_9NEOP|nr:jg19882 [Pararge aegeria aegeria]
MKDMKELLKILGVGSLELGLCINKSKTKLMIVDRSGNLLDTANIRSVDIVEDYIYLGSQICNDGSCVPEIKRRIAMAKSAMIRVGSIWKNRGITFNTKSRLVCALIFPIFMYGAETWTIKAGERQRIDAFEIWCWRRMLRIPWTAKRTSVSILVQLGVSVRLSSICYQRLLSYFGHIMWRGNSCGQHRRQKT